MGLRICVLGDIHGNVAALEAALRGYRGAPTRPAVHHRRPGAQRTASGRDRPAPDGAGQGGRLHRRRQYRYRGRGWRLRRGVPVAGRGARGSRRGRRVGTRPAGRRRSWTGSGGCRRSDACGSDDALVLLVHASPGSQTAGLSADLDPATTVQRVTRSDARVLCVGHTHVAEVRELGRKLIVNPGACGYAMDGDPAAGWALVDARGGRGADGRAAPDRPTMRRQWPRRSAPAASWATSTGPPPSAPGGSSDEPAPTRGRHGHGCGHAPGHHVETFWSAARGGRVRCPDHHLLRPVPGGLHHRRVRCSTSIPARCSTARRSGATTGRPRWPWWPPGRRWTTRACRPGWKGSTRSTPASSSGPAWAARAPSSTRSSSTTSGAPTGSARSSSPWPSPTWPRARCPSASVRWAPTSRPRAPVPAPAMPSARRPRSILRGDAEVMFAGGAEAMRLRGDHRGLRAMRALSTRNDDPAGASRPYDSGRDGFVLAEGAATLVLEELGHARGPGRPHPGRGLRLCRIRRCQPHHVARARWRRRAACRPAGPRKAGLDASEIDLVAAHATSTPAGDMEELAAIRSLLGERAPRVAVTAIKGAIGHTIGAAGGHRG